MFRPLEVFVGLRYTRAKRRNHFISFISLLSMSGIALGVLALITILSVMNGFEKELRERILGMASHATISGAGGTLADWQSLVEKSNAHSDVVGVAPYVEAQGMLTRGQAVQGALIRGILPSEEPNVSELTSLVVEGDINDLKPGSFGIVLGNSLALTLGARVGTKVTLVAPAAKVTPAGIIPRMRRFTVVGIFRVDHGQYDTGLGIVHLDDAARLFQLKDNVSGLRVKLDDMFKAPRVSRELALSFKGQYWVTNWTQHHANFFKALKTEKTVMFVIVSLIVLVSAFNIVSTLIMVVTDKEADIAILRTLGISPRSVMAIFMVQGTIIGFVGTLLGLIGGVALAQNVETLVPRIESLFGVQFLSPDIYFISQVPSDMRWADVTLITVLAFILTVLATIYPAWRASRTQPAEALRYE